MMRSGRQSTLRAALLAAGLLLTAACSAGDGAGKTSTSPAPAATPSAPTPSNKTAPAKTTAFSEGKQYVRIAPAGQPAANGPIVMVEVFSYACPHCAEFAPDFDKLRSRLPKDVQIRYMPAVFNQTWEPFARAFYTAKQLGVLKQTHDALLQAMLQHYPLNSLDDLADFYASHGVDRAKFLDAANSPQTTAQLATDQQIEQGWGIDATPTLIVGHAQSAAADAPVAAEYRSADVASYDELARLGGWLVKKEEAQAPAK
ncbi:MAG: thiol:disulfide interchange protein DsbA/DsbL [Rhodanobacteraceae bacterium]